MVFPRLCLVGFNYAQPFLISSAIAYVSKPVAAQNKNDGYGLIGAAGIIYIGIAVCPPFVRYICWLMRYRFQQPTINTKSIERPRCSEDLW